MFWMVIFMFGVMISPNVAFQVWAYGVSLLDDLVCVFVEDVVVFQKL